MTKDGVLLGALYGAVGMWLRAALIVRSGGKVPLWYLAIDTFLCGTLGTLAFGLGIEMGFGMWASASLSGIAGSIGPHLVRYSQIVVQKHLGIPEQEQTHD